jgi:FAD synthetase
VRKVLVFGTFDNLHPGHLNFLKQAKKKGDWLIASVARDAFVEKIKGQKPRHGEVSRRTHLMRSGLVNEAHLSDETPGTYSIIQRLKPDVVCFGHDQGDLKENLLNWLASRGITLQTYALEAYRPEKYKSSLYKPQRNAKV